MGYSSEDKKLDAEILKSYIFGGNVSEYMEFLQEEDADKYQTHFVKALGEDLDSDSIEDMYKEVTHTFQSRTLCSQGILAYLCNLFFWEERVEAVTRNAVRHFLNTLPPAVVHISCCPSLPKTK